ncbi:hypothetical protein K439DRAFT_313579 [Ramaria rubella]|nr:hypothetical protein K439DRAFT_313579 [Ramaria rubella]
MRFLCVGLFFLAATQTALSAPVFRRAATNDVLDVGYLHPRYVHSWYRPPGYLEENSTDEDYLPEEADDPDLYDIHPSDEEEPPDPSAPFHHILTTQTKDESVHSEDKHQSAVRPAVPGGTTGQSGHAGTSTQSSAAKRPRPSSPTEAQMPPRKKAKGNDGKAFVPHPDDNPTGKKKATQ